jgi:hypothetical protein
MSSSCDENLAPQRTRHILPNQAKRKRTMSPHAKSVATLASNGAVRNPKPKLPPHVHAQLAEANIRIATLETDMEGILQKMKSRIRSLEDTVRMQKSQLQAYQGYKSIPSHQQSQAEMESQVSNLKVLLHSARNTSAKVSSRKDGQQQQLQHQQMQMIMDRVGALAGGHPSTCDHVDAIKEMFER